MLAVRRTSVLGGWATAALFVIVVPANVQMAMDGGIAGASFPANSVPTGAEAGGSVRR